MLYMAKNVKTLFKPGCEATLHVCVPSLVEDRDVDEM